MKILLVFSFIFIVSGIANGLASEKECLRKAQSRCIVQNLGQQICLIREKLDQVYEDIYKELPYPRFPKLGDYGCSLEKEIFMTCKKIAYDSCLEQGLFPEPDKLGKR